LKARILTRIECGSVYLEMNVHNSALQVIDFSNDVLNSMRPGQVGIAEFVSYETGHLLWRLTEASCY